MKTLAKILFLSVFCVLFILFSFACRKPISHFQPGMTQADVIRAWGNTPLQTFKILNGKTYEIWQYNFRGGVCYVVFNDKHIIATHVEQPQRHSLTIRDALLLKLITR